MATDKKEWNKLASKLGLKHAGFFPVESLEDKQNFKRLLKIHQDGSVEERVFLDVPEPSHREFLICMHYMKHKVRMFHEEEIGVSLEGRDDPWDFRLSLSSGEKFNVEITAIADSSHHFEMTKREERLSSWAGVDTIPLYELQKLNQFFPDQKITRLIEQYLAAGKTPTDDVMNPLLRPDQRILIGNMRQPETPLIDNIQQVISKKVAKKHNDKHQTVLIVDNRTSAFDTADYQAAVSELESYVDGLPFPEIWFYTGYCSDDNGNNAEFSFAPLKLSKKQWSVMQKIASTEVIDRYGRFVW